MNAMYEHMLQVINFETRMDDCAIDAQMKAWDWLDRLKEAEKIGYDGVLIWQKAFHEWRDSRPEQVPYV